MSLEEQKIAGYAAAISALPDKIENKAAWLKSRFDARTDGEVKEKHNGLVDALKDPAAGEELGLRAEGLAAATVAGAARELFLKEAAHEEDRENPHGVTAAQTGAYSIAETERRLNEKVTEIGAGDMAKAVYDPDNDGVIDNGWSLTGGKIIGKDTDLNDYREVGNYVCHANVIAVTLKKIPAGLNRAFTLKVCAPLGAGETRKQILKEYFTARQYERTYLPDNESWTNWEAMDKAAQEMAASKLPLEGGTLTGDIRAPHYRTSIPDGGYYLNGGAYGGKKIDYRLHANDGAFWIRRYEDGQPIPAPLTITAAGVCNINGRAESAGNADTAATAAKAGALQINNGTAYALRVNYTDQVCIPTINGQARIWNEARYLMADATNKTIAAEWALDKVWSFCPRTDANHPLGLAFKRWSGIYLTSSPSVTSDRREKHDIEALDAEKAAAFVAALRPVTYRYNDGTSGRTHWGLIAQDVEETMADCGLSDMDFAGFIRSPKMEEYETGEKDARGEPVKARREAPGEYLYSLRYEEFIAPVIAAVQAQEKRLEKQEKEIAALTERLAALEKGREEVKE